MLATGGPLTGNFQIGVLASALGTTGATAFSGLAAAAISLGFAAAPGIRDHLDAMRLEELTIEKYSR